MAKPQTSKATDLLSLIESATAEDLAELDAEIAGVENRLTSLQAVRKVIAKRLGVEEPAKGKRPRRAVTGEKPAAAKAAPAGTPLRDRILESIAMDGPDTIAVLAKKLDSTYQSAYAAVNDSEWFEKDVGGKVKLTNVGWQTAKERKVGSTARVA